MPEFVSRRSKMRRGGRVAVAAAVASCVVVDRRRDGRGVPWLWLQSVRNPAGRPDLRQRRPAADEPVDLAAGHPHPRQPGAAGVKHAQPGRHLCRGARLERVFRLPHHHQPQDADDRRPHRPGHPGCARGRLLGGRRWAAFLVRWHDALGAAVDLPPALLVRSDDRHGDADGCDPAVRLAAHPARSATRTSARATPAAPSCPRAWPTPRTAVEALRRPQRRQHARASSTTRARPPRA